MSLAHSEHKAGYQIIFKPLTLKSQNVLQQTQDFAASNDQLKVNAI